MHAARRDKGIAIAFLFGALLVGGGLGFTADRLARGAIMPSRAELRDQFARTVQLTTAQRSAVDSILDRRNRDLDSALGPLRPRLDSIRERARQEIRQRLDPAQRKAFETFLAEQRQRHQGG